VGSDATESSNSLIETQQNSFLFLII